MGNRKQRDSLGLKIKIENRKQRDSLGLKNKNRK
jgi:hypothetical protein